MRRAIRDFDVSNERKSRFTLLAKTVTQALTRAIKTLPTDLRRSLTWDRGPEMTEHLRFSLATGMKVYFCGPAKPVAARDKTRSRSVC